MIKNIQAQNYSQIYEVLRKAMERSYGPQVKLNLHMQTLQYARNARVSSFQIKELLTNYKNIISLNIQLRIDPDILLQPDLELTNIERLDIDFYDVDSFHHICENIIARYADKLEHLSVKKLKNPDDTVLQVDNLTELKSLELKDVDNKIMNTFVNAVNKDFITHLSLSEVYGFSDIEQFNNPRFENLQYLKLEYIYGDAALSFIKCNKETITELRLYGVNFTNSDNTNINIPKLRKLEISYISGDAALSLIKCNKDTITELILSNVDFTNTSLPVVEMPRLKHLYLQRYENDYEYQIRLLTKAFGRNLTVLWTFDHDILTYKWISTEELKNIKIRALALH